MTTETKQYLKDELKSFITTFISMMVMFEPAILGQLWDGDFSTTTLVALGMACVRSGVKAMITLLAPKITKTLLPTPKPQEVIHLDLDNLEEEI